MARGAKRGTKSIARRGLMLVLSSPSGAGKTTLSRMLLTEERNITLSISVTTRPRRPGEVDGRHYHFIDRKRFEQLRRNGELLEYAEVFGNFYGTPRKPVERALKGGRDVLFDVIDPYVYQEALDLIALHRSEGRRIYVVSSSPEEVPVPTRTVVSPSSRCTKEEVRSTVRTRSSGAERTCRLSRPRRSSIRPRVIRKLVVR